MSEAIMRFGGYEATPENASLFLFVGKTAIGGMEFENHLVNHIFIAEEKEDEVLRGAYAFLYDLGEDRQSDILNFMINNGYTVHLNLHEVPDCDMRAWQRHVDEAVQSEKIEDFIPDEWGNE